MSNEILFFKEHFNYTIIDSIEIHKKIIVENLRLDVISKISNLMKNSEIERFPVHDYYFFFVPKSDSATEQRKKINEMKKIFGLDENAEKLSSGFFSYIYSGLYKKICDDLESQLKNTPLDYHEEMLDYARDQKRKGTAKWNIVEAYMVISPSKMLKSITLEAGTKLYRGESLYFERVPNKLIPTRRWYSLYESVALRYMKRKSYGYLKTVELRKTIKLLEITDLNTVNSLLRISFAQEKSSQQEKDNLYEIVKKFFLGAGILESYQLFKKEEPTFDDAKGKAMNFSTYKNFFSEYETDKTPWQLREVLRNTCHFNDDEFAKYVCDWGYDGFYGEKVLSSMLGDWIRNESKGDTYLGQEIMLCNPEDVLYKFH
mgnify:CR=1 FL=1